MQTAANQKPIGPTAVSIPELRAVFDGRVISPDDAAYDAARRVFYGGVDPRPAAIVRAKDASDVSRTVSLARSDGGASVGFLGEEGEARVREARTRRRPGSGSRRSRPLRPGQPLQAQPEHPASESGPNGPTQGGRTEMKRQL